MDRDGLDALVVSEKNNYWYFSGLISYQLDHIQRPQICILPKSGKPLLLVYGNDKAKAKALPWVGEVRAYTDVPFPQEMIAGSYQGNGPRRSQTWLRARRRSTFGYSRSIICPGSPKLCRKRRSKTALRRSPKCASLKARGNRVHAQSLRHFRQSL